MKRERHLRLLLGIPAVVLVFILLILPIANMVDMSFRASGASSSPYGEGYSLASYNRALGDGFYLQVLWRSIYTAAIVTILCLLVSYPLAWHMSRATGRKALILYALVVSPLMTGVLVRNFGWMIIVALNGPLNGALMGMGIIERPIRMLFTQGLVILALVHVFTPFMVLPINNALRGINPSVIEASDSLGASRFSTFWKVILPLSFTGVQPGVILVFVLAVAAYVTPALLGGQMVMYMPTMIVRALTGSFDWPFGSTLALMLSVSVGAVVVAFTALTWRLMDRVRA